MEFEVFEIIWLACWLSRSRQCLSAHPDESCGWHLLVLLRGAPFHVWLWCSISSPQAS